MIWKEGRYVYVRSVAGEQIVKEWRALALSAAMGVVFILYVHRVGPPGARGANWPLRGRSTGRAQRNMARCEKWCLPTRARLAQPRARFEKKERSK